MGYYTTITESTVNIPADKLDAAYEAACALNTRHGWKSGGAFPERACKHATSTSVGNPNRWFAWVAWNYDETCKNLKEVLDEFKFYVTEEDDGSLSVQYYASKIGDEDLLFEALAEFIPDEQEILWQGEDGAQYGWRFRDGKLIRLATTITWEEQPWS